jgi:ribonucleotide reductase class II
VCPGVNQYHDRQMLLLGERETWAQVCDRTLGGLVELGQLTDAERDLIARMQGQVKACPRGGGCGWGAPTGASDPKTFSGAYNCTSTNVLDWRAFGLMMDLAMMGCGTGAVLEPKYINQLPAIRNRLAVTQEGAIGTTPVAERQEVTVTDHRRQPGHHSGGRQPPGLGEVLPDHLGTF